MCCVLLYPPDHPPTPQFSGVSMRTRWLKEQRRRLVLKHFNGFCTGGTHEEKSLKVQLQLAVTPAPITSTNPAHPPSPHRCNVDCAILISILLLWLQNAHYSHQVTRAQQRRKAMAVKPRPLPRPLSSFRSSVHADVCVVAVSPHVLLNLLDS